MTTFEATQMVHAVQRATI